MKTAEPEGEWCPDQNMVVHDVSVSYLSPYPCDLAPEQTLVGVMEHISGAGQFADMVPIVCAGTSSQKVFVNLFWLFFCARFQPAAFSDVGVTDFMCIYW